MVPAHLQRSGWQRADVSFGHEETHEGWIPVQPQGVLRLDGERTSTREAGSLAIFGSG